MKWRSGCSIAKSDGWSAPSNTNPVSARGQQDAPSVHIGRGICFDHLINADVHETQTAPGLNVLVAISADEEGRASVEVMMTVTVMVPVAMTMVSAMLMTTMTASRSRGHGGSTERDSGDEGE